MKAPRVRTTVFGLSLAVSFAAACLVFRGETRPWLAVLWLLSLVAFVLATRHRRPAGASVPRSTAAAALLLALAAALPVLVRVANMDPGRIHGDEYITGYFSATHDFAHKSLFGYMPEKWEWQGQFPKLYFFIQKVFMTVVGTGPAAPRLSVQVYVAIVSVMLFLIVREMLNRNAAIVAVILYSFLAISVYLETVGLFFIGATAVFMVFFYFALREYRTEEMFAAAMSGVACALCYLMYYSSYLAFPILVAFYGLHWLRSRSVRVVQNFAIALGGFVIVLAPFAAFSLRAGNYALRRANDLSLFTGSASPYREAIANGTASPMAVLRDNLVIDLKSFFQDGIAGGGGFDFGRLAFFDAFSLGLLVLGLLLGAVLLRRKPEILPVFLVLGGVVAMVAITVPPPTCHRFALAFPFLVILMTLPFDLLLRFRKIPASVRYALAGGLLLLFASVNERRLADAVSRDATPDELRLSRFLNERYPGRNLYIAAYDAFGYQKIFYFFDTSKNRRVETGFHNNLLRKFNPKQKYVYVLTLGDDARERFEKADPRGRYYRFSIGYSIFAN